jgi:hypothetical protein
MRFKKGDTVVRIEPAHFSESVSRVRKGSVHVVEGYNRYGHLILEDDVNELGWSDEFFERAALGVRPAAKLPAAQVVESTGEAELELVAIIYASAAKRMGLSLAEAQARISAALERAGLT